jgi:hypothetical protein
MLPRPRYLPLQISRVAGGPREDPAGARRDVGGSTTSCATRFAIGFLYSKSSTWFWLFALSGRAGLEDADVRIFTGLFRQIEWYADKGWRVVQEKEKRGVKIR